MNGIGRRDTRRLTAALLGSAVIVTALLWKDRTSPERGNRLYRAGEIRAAAQIYRAHEADPAVPASYNLGTALVTLDAGDAQRQLNRVLKSADSAARQRAYYNLGLLFLISVDTSAGADATAALLTAAVASNRAALRLDPSDQHARWNLALAQRMLDSVPPRPAGWGEDKGTADENNPAGENKGLRSEDSKAVAEGGSSKVDNSAERKAEDIKPGDAGGQRSQITGGVSEAWAGQDPGRMTRAAALRLVRGIDDSPEPLIRGLLWSHRPKDFWSGSRQAPGGGW